MNTRMTFHIKTLSPVHLGCDEEYEPIAFVIDEGKNVLISFDPLTFMKSIPPQEREKFSAICRKGTVESLLEIYRFMRGRSFPGREVNLCSGFPSHYRKTLGLKDAGKIRNELNRFAIARTAFNPNTFFPYIPGSAIKGALRTAWLNKKQAEKRLPRERDARKEKDLEKKLLDGGSFSTDPFRMVKVSDFKPVGLVKSKIIYAVNKKKRLSKFDARGPYQILEVIQSDMVFEGTIAVEKPVDDKAITAPIEPQALFNSAIRFYVNVKKTEDMDLQKIGVPQVFIGDIPQGGFLLRIGRHSGAESLTVEGQRGIKIMKNRGEKEFLDHTTTLWLASEEEKSLSNSSLAPFGWVMFFPGNAPELVESELSKKSEVPIAQAVIKEPVKEKSEVEKLIEELSRIRPDDMGRIGTVIQNIERLPSPEEKAEIALAIRDKLGEKSFRKHKRREYLEDLIKKGQEWH